MKAIKITYWVSTLIISVMMLLAAQSYLFDEKMVGGFKYLGFPDFFRIELAIAKILGSLALIIPLCKNIKEWAYAGFAITFISAFVTHIALNDAFDNTIRPIIALAILVISYISYHKLHKDQCCKPKTQE